MNSCLASRMHLICILLVVLSLPTLAFAAPTITSLSPTSGAVGALVTITGTNFGTQGTNTVKFFNAVPATIKSWTATSIQVFVPQGAVTGNVVVTVSGVASAGKSFTVVPAPHITSLSQTSGAVTNSITITGTNLGSLVTGNNVSFNGTLGTTSSWAATTIKVPVPNGASSGNVIVHASGVDSNGINFTVVPNITSLTPTSGAIGTVVTIAGTSFGTSLGNSSVTFNGVPGIPAPWGASSIKVPVPSGATTGNVVVTVNGIVSNGKLFTVPAPTITSLSRTSGVPGTDVTITGTKFGSPLPSSTVAFNGAQATTKSWTATSIVATVPAAATTGNVVVTVAGAPSNGINFTVPTLTSISVTPASPSFPVASAQQFTATGIYSDASNANLTSSAVWSTSDPTVATIATSGIATSVGSGQATIQASAGTMVGATTLTVSPSRFRFTGSLQNGRTSQTATALPNGQVLLVGGGDRVFQPTASCELYDPVTGNFTTTGFLNIGRVRHTATLLSNGQVLIAGGQSLGGPQGTLIDQATAELYDPTTGLFTFTGSLNTERQSHTATMLSNGMVLIAGGHNQGTVPVTAELYDPSTGLFTNTGTLNTARQNHTATLLSDGTVLVAAGLDMSFSVAIGSAELFDPTTGIFTLTGNLGTARSDHSAIRLTNGTVLVVLGHDANFVPVATAEIYDPVAKTFLAAGSMATPRVLSSASLLSDGRVLITGGDDAASNVLSSAELYDATTGAFSPAGSMNIPRNSHTSTLLNDGTVLIAGGTNSVVFDVLPAELYEDAPVPPPPFSLQITPASATMQVGDTRQFTAVDNHGFPRPDATWTVNDTTLATATATSPITINAINQGQVTLTANAEGVTAQVQITISPAGVIVPGTVLWSSPPVPGFTPVQLVQATPTSGAPDLYSIQLSADGKQTLLQALTADGQQMWQASLPVVNGNSVPDGSGGLIVTEHNTCLPGQTDPMTIVDLDPATGQAKWQLAAAGVQAGFSGVVYCYPDTVKAFEPQIAIRGDGAIVVSAMTNNGLPPLSINGNVIPIQASTFTDAFGTQNSDFSPIGPPIVDSDNSVYVEYEVRHITYPPKITSAVLWLLKVAADNSSTAIQLSSTTNDENLLPGRIIPDGQGGILATWTISPSNGPPPLHPYQAVHVVSGIAGIPYGLPFTPQSVTAGQYPTLVLGENGTAFATDGLTQIASFDLNSGATNWSYQNATGGSLAIIAATDGGGWLPRSATAGIASFDLIPLEQ